MLARTGRFRARLFEQASLFGKANRAARLSTKAQRFAQGLAIDAHQNQPGIAKQVDRCFVNALTTLGIGRDKPAKAILS